MIKNEKITDELVQLIRIFQLIDQEIESEHNENTKLNVLSDLFIKLERMDGYEFLSDPLGELISLDVDSDDVAFELHDYGFTVSTILELLNKVQRELSDSYTDHDIDLPARLYADLY